MTMRRVLRASSVDALPLFAAGPGARASDPATSHTAAAMRPVSRDSDRGKVLLALYRYPAGLSDFGLEQQLGLKQTSCGKRRGELRDMGYVRDSGRTGLSDTNSKATIWELTPSGVEKAEELLTTS